MCYFNGQKVAKIEHIRLKQLEKAVAAYDFLNKDLQIGFDFGPNAILKKIAGEEDFEIVKMEWGFIPDADKWPFVETREDLFRMRNGYKDPRGQFHMPYNMLNAVSEELLQPGKIFRQAALKRRCLVLSSGFYEWRHVYPVNKRTGLPVKSPKKYPYHISLKGKEYFFMAGIWQPWTDATTGEYVESFAIVTTAANELMEQVHNSKKRMPTILTEELAYAWLLHDLPEQEISQIARFQVPASLMEACTIHKDFRDSFDPAHPFDYSELAPLEYFF